MMSAVAYLRVMTPPSLPPLPLEVIVLEGAENVTLPCAGSGDPDPEIDWIRGSLRLPIPGLQVQEPGGSLVLLEVGGGDGGEYVCRVANAAGIVYHTVTLTVRTFPNVLVSPSSLLVSVGCQATFFCSDGGSRPKEFQWRRNGRILTDPLPEGLDVLPSGELTIFDAQVSDSGNYTCFIWSLAGSNSSTATLVVVDPFFVGNGSDFTLPSIISPTPLHQAVPVGQTAQFACVATGFPAPDLVWLRDGEPLPRLQRITVGEAGSLTIQALRETDGAVYNCSASNELGEASRQFRLDIVVPPMIVIQPEALNLTEGQVIKLQCVTTGKPSPEIFWLKGADLLVDEGRFAVKTSYVEIYNTTTKDSGNYACVARNSAGTAEYTRTVTVRQLQFRPWITIPPRSSTQMAGTVLVLDCVASGFPTPVTTWYYAPDAFSAMVRLRTNGRVIVGQFSVFIQETEPQDTGQYTCAADNEAGRHVYEVFVTITPREVFPFFTTYPNPAWLNEGADLVLNCQASGSPQPTIDWLKNGELISSNLTGGNLTVLANGTLYISNTTVEDTGWYTCRATSEAGVNQVSVGVDVSPAMVEEGSGSLSSPPHFTSFPAASLHASPGEALLLDCAAEGFPFPTLQWLLDGLPPSSLFTHTLPNGSLAVGLVAEEDAGLYTCQAENEAGRSMVHVMLNVEQGYVTGNSNRETSPKFSVKPSDTSLLSGSTHTFHCQSKSQGSFIIWLKEDAPLCSNGGVSVGPNGSLTIAGASVGDGGLYTCVAVSAGGFTQKTVTLSVTPRKEPPYFVAWPRDTRVLVGSSFNLSCSTEAHSHGHNDTAPPTLEWRFGNRTLPPHSVAQLPASAHLDCSSYTARAERRVSAGSMIVVQRAELNDTGVYHCMAANRHGSVTAVASVRVLRRPVNAIHSVTKGSTTQLPCDPGTNGWPSANRGAGLQWEKDGQGLSPSSPRHLAYGDRVWLFGAGLEDEGEYACLHGNTTLANLFLEVLEPPWIDAHTSSRLVFASPGHTAALHCHASGRPTPVLSWKRAGQAVETNISSAGGRYSVLQNGTLLIYNLEGLADSGEYTCLAENRAGTTSASVVLVVGGALG